MYEVSGFFKVGLRALSVLCFMLLFAGKASATKFGVKTVTANATLSEDQFGAVVIAADNVTFDCAGFMVHSGAATPPTARIGIFAANRKNVVIKNCVVIGAFNVGIEILSNIDTHVETSRVTVTGMGYGFFGNSGLIGRSLDADNCGADGYRLDFNADMKLHFAWATGNGHHGFFETNGVRTVYDEDGRAGGNAMDGYLCQECTDVIYGTFLLDTAGVMANGNGGTGIGIGISKGIRVSHATANDNGVDGVFFGSVKNSPTAVSEVTYSSGINNAQCDAVSITSPGDRWDSTDTFEVYCGNFSD